MYYQHLLNTSTDSDNKAHWSKLRKTLQSEDSSKNINFALGLFTFQVTSNLYFFYHFIVVSIVSKTLLEYLISVF